MRKPAFASLLALSLTPQLAHAQAPEPIAEPYPLSASVLAGTGGSAIGGLVAGAVIGTHLVARHHGESASVDGEILAASLGVIAGIFVGVAVVEVMPAAGPPAFVIGYSITQGTITALAAQSTAR